MIKAIVFDFDGVLIESVDIKTKAFAKLFEGEGADVVGAVVRYHLEHTGVSRFEKFKHIYKNILKRELSKETFDRLCRQFSELVFSEVVAAPYVNGGKEFLESNSSVYKCFVASATPQREIEDIIKARNMGKYFAAVYGAPKKKSDAVKDVIGLCGISPGDLLYVGDALSDYEAAAANETHFIARINNNESVFTDIDCIKIPDLSSLKKILDSTKAR